MLVVCSCLLFSPLFSLACPYLAAYIPFFLSTLNSPGHSRFKRAAPRAILWVSHSRSRDPRVVDLGEPYLESAHLADDRFFAASIPFPFDYRV